MIIAALSVVAAPAGAAITYVGRVASTTVSTTSTSTSLTAGRSVTAGDAIVVAVLLSSTSSTAAKVTDSAGNAYALDRDQNDGSAGDRVLMFSATSAKALPTGGTITITYPSSAECHASADEFAGIGALERAASTFATGTSFNSGASGTTSQASELILGLVGVESGNAPVFAAGWTALPTLSIIDDRLTLAYQIASSAGSFTASGTISGTWMAAVLAYPGSGPPPEAPPVAALAVTQVVTPPLTVSASAAGSTDTDATPIASYSFNFGDGTPAVVVNAPTQTASHTYAAAGTYTVTLTATDTGNLTSTPVTKSITVVADAPPGASLAVTQVATPPLTVTASAAGSTDTDGTPIASYSFNFGDGTPAVVVNAPTQTASHTYAAAGTYTVTLTATDTGSLTSTPVTKSITVVAEQAPTASLSVAQIASPAFTVTASGAGSTDPDLTPIASYSFNFGDGTPAVVVNAPTQTATHTYAAAGTYTVSLTVGDTGGLNSTPVTSSITVTADQPPAAVLSVTPAPSPPLTVTASGAGSTDTDATPIASYSFNFGDGTSAVVTTAPTSSTTHTYAAAGTYAVTLTVTDTGGLKSTPVTSSITLSPALEKRVAASTDDAAESNSTGKVTTSGTTLPLATQTVGMRWPGLAIPPGATITAAWVQFTAGQTQSGASTLNLFGQAADNAATFSRTTASISSRPHTVATTAWAPAAWATVGQAGAGQRTPDLSAVIQEVVSRPGWASGNALAIIVTGSGQRTAYAYDGNSAAAALLHVEYTTGPPPPDQPPVAKLSATQAGSPPLTVNASAAGSTDTDSSPIASYSFDWGDGSAKTVVNAPTQTASHTYAAAGTYTVTLTAIDTANLTSTPVTTSITVAAAAQPPVASLSVTQAASPPLTASASGAGSTAGTNPIASYSFSFGDGSAAVVVNAPTQTATHTYAAAGTYTVTLTVTDTGGLKSTPVTASVTVTGSSSSPTAIYVGYYDTHHAVNPQPKPNPWQGSANVVFIGVSDHNDNNWDTACIRVDNLTGGALSGVVVTADLGSNHFALWGTNSIPAGYHLILAQTAYQNFDGSDTNPAGCYGCDPNLCLTERSSDVPVVHVTVNSTTKDYFDTGQVMNTGGYDGAGCPYVGGSLPTTRYDESHAWAQVFTSSGAAIVASPSAITSPGSQPPNLPRVLSLARPYPNPTRGVLALRFSLPSQGPVWLGLYDVSGRQVRTYLNNILDAGEYNLQRDLSDVRPGVYFVRLWTPSAMKHERVIIAP
jgi:PKD repeat protein